jgi:hypothetical protein
LDICYEDLLASPTGTLKQVAEFVQQPTMDDRLDRISAGLKADRAFAYQREQALRQFANQHETVLQQYGYST